MDYGSIMVNKINQCDTLLKADTMLSAEMAPMPFKKAKSLS
jgi:hypothetical protein